MQHTDKYNFNIIEPSDVFGPELLNENTRTLVAQLDAVRNEFADAGSALDGRLGTLETGRLLWTTGTYTGNGNYGASSPTRIEFPFRPLMVLIADSWDISYGGFPWVYGQSVGKSHHVSNYTSGVTIRWSSRAIEFYTTTVNTYGSHQLNQPGRPYVYFALGVEDCG